ncbi:hypothetical protein LINPERHAP1_LOCUS8238, partial [Linum perenne]
VSYVSSSTFSFLIIFSRLYSYFLNLVFSGQIIKAPALYECDEAGAGGRAFSSFLSVDLLSVVGEGVAATSALTQPWRRCHRWKKTLGMAAPTPYTTEYGSYMSASVRRC